MGAALAPATVSHLFDAAIAEEIDAATTVGTARMGPQSAIEAWNPVLASLVTGLAMCAVVTVFRWWLGLLLAAAWYLARRLRWRQSAEYLNTLGSESIGTRRQAYFRLLGTTPPAAKEIRVFGLSRWLTERFHEQWRVGIEPTWTLRRSRRSSLAVTLVVLVAVNVLAVLVVADAANTGAIGVETLTLLLQAILGARVMSEPGTVTTFDMVFTAGARTIHGVRRLEARLGTMVGDRTASTGPEVPGRPPERLDTGIRFDDVSFTYPGAGRRVLDHLDLTIEAGTSLALVGENGAGKTTLVRLLAGLVTPSSGTIRADGRDLRDVDVEAWRERLAVVFQNFACFPVSARQRRAGSRWRAPRR